MANMYPSKKKPTEHRTTLWTNSSPTSSFAAQSVTLSNTTDYHEFDYIVITVRRSTSNSTENEYYAKPIDNTNFRAGLGYYNSSEGTFNRLAQMGGSATSIYFQDCKKISSSSTSNSNGSIIPIKIEGVKYQ